MHLLEAFGIEQDAERVYLALLADPAADTAALGKELSMGTAAVTAACRRLTQLMLLRPSLEDPGTLRPVSPEVGLEALLTRQRADLVKKRSQITDGQAALAVLLAERRGSRQSGAASQDQAVRGLDAIRAELEQLACSAQTEVLTLVPRGVPGPHWDLLHELPLARGVEVRTVHADSIRNDPAALARARRAGQLGAHVRTVPLLPLWMQVVDRQVAVLPTAAERGAPGITVVSSPQAAKAFGALFDHFWAGARQLDQAVRRGADGLTAQEVSLLRLLAEGDTDHVIARKLGVSARTVGRVVSDLMSRLGAQSRFQAGLRAAEHGWLAGPAVAPPRPAARVA